MAGVTLQTWPPTRLASHRRGAAGRVWGALGTRHLAGSSVSCPGLPLPPTPAPRPGRMQPCPLPTLPLPLVDSQRHRVTEEEAQQSRFQMPPLVEGKSAGGRVLGAGDADLSCPAVAALYSVSVDTTSLLRPDWEPSC